MRRFVAALALVLSIPAAASTYTVDDPGDAPDFLPGDDVCSTAPAGGVCTLRAAIQEANAHAGDDRIEFDITGTLSPATPYPSIVQQVIIDGTSAPGYAGSPLVAIDGDTSSLTVGLHFAPGSDLSRLFALEINGFSVTAVRIDANTVRLRRNWLGPVSQGQPNRDGLQLNGSGSIIGGLDGQGNVISGNDGSGIVATGSGHDIRDNFIGTDETGTASLGNSGDGIRITGGATGITIGSATAGEENVISENDAGVNIEDGSGNTVAGNFIGTDVTGTNSLSNTTGVAVNAAGNTIGTAAAGNVISGNFFDNVVISADDTVVHNNVVDSMVVTIGFGIDVSFASNIDIGGSGPGEGNVVTHHPVLGITFFEVDNSRIVNNEVIDNGTGINLVDAFDVTVASNLVSDNSGGIEDIRGINNVIESNRVETTADGNSADGNSGMGIEISGSMDTIVRSNIVSANGAHGIEVRNDSIGTVIHSNIIGLGADLTTVLGNGGDGIHIRDGASGTVAGSVALSGNTIAGNGANGIGVGADALQNNTWAANSIDDNALLGIDLGIDGVTPNDLDDPDTGANNLQNFPVLESAVTSPGQSWVTGTINTRPGTAFTIHFYSSPDADPSGFGEGRTFLGALSGTTDAGGDASFVFNGPALTIGDVVTATATTADGSSEFSAAETVGAAGTIASIDDVSLPEGDDFVFTITLSAAVDVDVTVNYTTANGTAIAGSDYTAQSDVAVIAAGSTSTTITVPTTEDALFEPDETFFVNLSGATNATIADDQATGTIENDDTGEPAADLSISKTTTATTFTPGQEITYTITVENAGPFPATDVTVTDELPPGTSLVSATSPDAVCNGTTTVTCTIAALPSSGTATITLVVVATGNASITNTATVSAAAPPDTAAANNSAFAVIAPAAVAGEGIPTLSEWALLLLAMMLAGVAMRRT